MVLDWLTGGCDVLRFWSDPSQWKNPGSFVACKTYHKEIVVRWEGRIGSSTPLRSGSR